MASGTTIASSPRHVPPSRSVALTSCWRTSRGTPVLAPSTAEEREQLIAFLCLRLEVYFMSEHINRSVKQVGPAVPPGVVGPLLLHQAANHGGVQVDSVLVLNAEPVEDSLQSVQHGNGRRIR